MSSDSLRIRAWRILTLSPFALAVGCCGYVDGTRVVQHPELRGVVVIVNPVTSRAHCTGSVLAFTGTEEAAGAYVLTARHCIHGDMGNQGVAVPPVGHELSVAKLEILPAKVVLTPADTKVHWDPAYGALWDASDWVLLRVETSRRLERVQIAGAAPFSSGETLSLAGYHDTSFGATLRPHEHFFSWGTRTDGLVEGGHSGAPVFRDGKLVAMFSGAKMQECGWCLSAGHRPETLLFVNVVAVLAEARRRGFALATDPAEVADSHR